ncbi:molybdopterin molybdenumtransferase MoeA [Aliishimia ponticola]|uniref:Molybdopterin molybdenumtransferase n=1 Tax=Aliishimia ponticola TaxID=2499833 RepID=A0A4S4N5K6_9RHOB|nr:gephyrin-like molybdotransferase Glp [Aliishimia ponticola]THH34376.1 molybdopterin molybdenumtransferase MoeA [Aliishimia ponticola]
MRRFDTVIVVDWSGGNDTGAAPRKDAIWVCAAQSGQAEDPVYLRNRQDAETWLSGRIAQERQKGHRVLVGFDFAFAYPSGFAEALLGSDDPVNPLDVWAHLADAIADMPERNNRFDLAGDINRGLGQGKGPFWGNALQRDIVGLPRTKQDYANPFPERRTCEARAKGSFTCWQLAGAGAVGSQTLMGLPVLHRLRERFGMDVTVWPFEPLGGPVAFVEIWPSLVLGSAPDGEIRDAWQVREMAIRISALSAEALRQITTIESPEARREGWIFGLGHEELLQQTPLVPPPLRNDCFALPAGVDWIPVDDAIAHLRAAVSVQATEITDAVLHEAVGRVLAEDVQARTANPPYPNTAVDGYGFAGAMPEGPHVLPLVQTRAAAGDAPTPVPAGHAVRILTGAVLPAGVETVVLQEDVTSDGNSVAFNGPIRQGANTRKAGEDVQAGETILTAGRVLTPADIALAAATGHPYLPVRRKLRVGVISTGSELREPGTQNMAPGLIHDANRPMLLTLLAEWGFEPVDLGTVEDDRERLRARFDEGASRTDAILTSGGASAGDEDHVSALLRAAGAMQMWRIAVKPGRPLALGMWDGVPVFGLPGNPVAALVCAFIFARPALGVMAGRSWQPPQAYDLPARFSKTKKPGRREYLRARVRDGGVEVFSSEGSGRISGLSWAEGLVELPDGAAEVRPGDPVRYLPFRS